jgi:hypothetical protein
VKELEELLDKHPKGIDATPEDIYKELEDKYKTKLTPEQKDKIREKLIELVQKRQQKPENKEPETTEETKEPEIKSEETPDVEELFKKALDRLEPKDIQDFKAYEEQLKQKEEERKTLQESMQKRLDDLRKEVRETPSHDEQVYNEASGRTSDGQPKIFGGYPGAPPEQSADEIREHYQKQIDDFFDEQDKLAKEVAKKENERLQQQKELSQREKLELEQRYQRNLEAINQRNQEQRQELLKKLTELAEENGKLTAKRLEAESRPSNAQPAVSNEIAEQLKAFNTQLEKLIQAQNESQAREDALRKERAEAKEEEKQKKKKEKTKKKNEEVQAQKKRTGELEEEIAQLQNKIKDLENSSSPQRLPQSEIETPPATPISAPTSPVAPTQPPQQQPNSQPSPEVQKQQKLDMLGDRARKYAAKAKEAKKNGDTDEYDALLSDAKKLVSQWRRVNAGETVDDIDIPQDLKDESLVKKLGKNILGAAKEVFGTFWDNLPDLAEIFKEKPDMSYLYTDDYHPEFNPKGVPLTDRQKRIIEQNKAAQNNFVEPFTPIRTPNRPFAPASPDYEFPPITSKLTTPKLNVPQFTPEQLAAFKELEDHPSPLLAQPLLEQPELSGGNSPTTQSVNNRLEELRNKKKNNPTLPENTPETPPQTPPVSPPYTPDAVKESEQYHIFRDKEKELTDEQKKELSRIQNELHQENFANMEDYYKKLNEIIDSIKSQEAPSSPSQLQQYGTQLPPENTEEKVQEKKKEKPKQKKRIQVTRRTPIEEHANRYKRKVVKPKTTKEQKVKDLRDEAKRGEKRPKEEQPEEEPPSKVTVKTEKENDVTNKNKRAEPEMSEKEKAAKARMDAGFAKQMKAVKDLRQKQGIQRAEEETGVLTKYKNLKKAWKNAGYESNSLWHYSDRWKELLPDISEYDIELIRDFEENLNPHHLGKGKRRKKEDEEKK